MIIPRYR